MFNQLRIATILIFALILSSCSSMANKPNLGNTTDANWYFNAKGKISITMGNKNNAGTLNWEQKGYEYDVSIYSAFGVGIRITGAPFFVEAKLPGGKYMQAASLDYLLQRGLDFPLPLSNMAYWIRGLNAPSVHLWQNDKTILEQDGWHIEYSRYEKVGGFAAKLPTKIDMRYGELKIRIIIKEWIKI